MIQGFFFLAKFIGKGRTLIQVFFQIKFILKDLTIIQVIQDCGLMFVAVIAMGLILFGQNLRNSDTLNYFYLQRFLGLETSFPFLFLGILYFY